MTINKVANQRDVTHRSGLLGWEGMLFRQLPEKASTNTTGSSSSVGTSDFATTIQAGSTAGDTAQLRGWYGYGHASTISKATVELVYYLRSAPPYDDEFEIGWCKDTIGDTMSFYFDLTTEDYHASVGTAPATIPSGIDQATHLIIEADYDRNVTTFMQSGAVNEEVEIADVPNADAALGPCLVNAKSNGNGDSVRVTYARQTMEF